MFEFFKKKSTSNINKNQKNLINDFDEEKYLEANPDVKEAVEKGVYKSGLEHLEKYGLEEIRVGKRKFHPEYDFFNEEKYLKKFPDIKEAVKKGLFNSGFEHFCLYGYKEIIEGKREWRNIKKINVINNNKKNIDIAFSENNEENEELLKVKNDVLKYYPFEELLNNTEYVDNNSKFKTVAIIAELSLPQCTKYRVNQMKEIFLNNGFNVVISSYNDFWRCLEILQYSDLVVFYRVPYGVELEVYLLEIMRLGIDYFYDIDDPIFDIDVVTHNENINDLDLEIKKNVIKDANKYKLAMLNFNNFIVSTPGLKENIEKLFNNVNVIIRRNAVDKESYIISKEIIKNEKKKNENVKLVYATPSLAHNKDFEIIKNVLIRLFIKYRKKIELVLIGNVSLPEELKKFSKYIKIKPAGDYKYLLNNLYECDINLVPLIFNDFNATKSNIKFIDAALVKVPSICSKIGDYSILESGKDSILVETNLEDEWFKKLSTLIEDEKLRKKLSENAYMRINREFSINQIGENFINNLKNYM